jgi:hypothetical protein
MLTQANMQSLLRVITAQPALNAAVSALWQPAFEPNNSLVEDLVGGLDFTRVLTGDGNAQLNETGLGGALVGARGMRTTELSDSTWALGAAGDCNIGAATAFVFGGIFWPELRPTGLRSWLAKWDDGVVNAPGYRYRLNTDDGTVDLRIQDTAGTAVTATIANENHIGQPHPFVGGRSITNNIISMCTELGRATAASGALGSLSTTALLRMAQVSAGAVVCGMTGSIGHLWFATDAVAEALLGEDLAICAAFAGLLGN